MGCNMSASMKDENMTNESSYFNQKRRKSSAHKVYQYECSQNDRKFGVCRADEERKNSLLLALENRSRMEYIKQYGLM